MTEIKKRKVGRPSKYDTIDLEKVSVLGGLGLTAEEISLVLGISKKTFYNYRDKPEFLHAIKEGRAKADTEIVSELRKQARKGNVPSMIFWLKNRQPDRWRDRHDLGLSGNVKTDSTLEVKIVQVKDGDDKEGENADNN
jgi:hypothetical protein